MGSRAELRAPCGIVFVPVTLGACSKSYLTNEGSTYPLNRVSASMLARRNVFVLLLQTHGHGRTVVSEPMLAR